MRKLFIFFQFIALCFATVLPVYAAGSSDMNAGGIGIVNPKISFNAETDEGKTQNITLFNSSSQPIKVTAQLMDFHLNENNAYVLENPNTTENSGAKCLQFDNKEFTLNPGAQLDVPVTLRSGCDYYLPELQSTIVFKYEPDAASNPTAGSSVTTYFQIMAFVWIEAGGKYIGEIDNATPPVSLVDLDLKAVISSKALQNISVTLKNSGVLTVNPSFTSEIKSNLTNDSTELPVDVTFLLPNSEKSASLSYSPKQLFDYSTYTLSYQYNYNGKDFSDSISKSFFVISIPVLCGMAVIFLGFILQLAMLIKRQRQTRDHRQS